MDPFLEHPERFPGFHASFIAALKATLQPRLPEPYYADSGRRSWIEVSGRFIEPDVQVLEPRRTQKTSRERQRSASIVVEAPPSTRPIVIHVPHDERREPFIEIYVGERRDRRLVTTIEVLSPSNKSPGEQGRDLYLRKQREVLESKVHLVEIDLLRAGEHTTAVPRRRLLAKAGSFDYHVCIKRFDEFEDYVVYPIRIAERLPEVAIPLLPGDPSIPIDLQAAFARAYDEGPYRREVRYGKEAPVPPFSAEQKKWAAGVLRRR
jgi:hypothetical protein